MARRRGHKPGRHRSSIPARVAVAGAIAVIAVEVVAIGVKSSHLGGSTTVEAAGDAAPTVPPTLPADASTSTTSPVTAADSSTAAATTSATTVVRAAGSTTYELPTAATVTVSTSGSTWMEVRRTRTGPVIATTTLSAGQTRSYPTPVWIRFGDPTGVTVTAGGQTLAVPTKQGPTDLAVTAPSGG